MNQQPGESADISQREQIMNIPLSIGQAVVVAASAFGYDTQADNITIPYNNYDHALHLMPLNKAATNGSWNVVVLIKSNKYGNADQQRNGPGNNRS